MITIFNKKMTTSVLTHLHLLKLLLILVEDISKQGLILQLAAAAAQSNSFQPAALQAHFML